MSTAHSLDIESLLAPISAEKPAGEDPREDFSPESPYQQIKDVRNAARAAERNVVANDDGTVVAPPADWKPILELAPTILTEKGKDLEVAAWLTEALVRTDGFVGLRDGFQLLRELVERFWDTVFPLPDDDDMEARLFPVSGLNGEGGNGTLLTPIINVPITEGHEFGPYAYSHFTQALSVERIVDPEKKQKRIDSGAVTKDKFDRAVRETSPEFFRQLFAEVESCRDEFKALCTLLDQKCGKLSPPSSSIREALEQISDAVKSFLPSETTDTKSAGQEKNEPTQSANVTAGLSADNIRNREEAFQFLLKVADFFRRTEPHTPVSYALEQAVRWGRLPLPQLLNELIADTSTRDAVFKQLGITLPTETPA